MGFNIVQEFLRGLEPTNLSETETNLVLDLMIELDPEVGPFPEATRARRLAARSFVTMWQCWERARVYAQALEDAAKHPGWDEVDDENEDDDE